MSQSSLTSKLHKGISVPSNIDFTMNFSPDGQAVTIIFSNVHMAIEPVQPSIQTKVFTLHIPYFTDQPSVTMTMDLRGSISTDAGMDVRLVACAGDTTKVVDLLTDAGHTIALRGRSKDAMAAAHPSLPWSDFQDRVEFTVKTRAANPVCQLTLFLLLEHNTDTAASEGVQLALDSLDLEIVEPGKGTYQL